MATIKRTKSGKYTILVRVDKSINPSGYKRFTGTDKQKVKAEALAFQLEHHENKSTVTVGQAIDAYISARENVLSPATVRAYKKIRRLDLQGLMNIPIDNLTQKKVQTVVNEESKTKSPKSISCAHALVYTSIKNERPDFTLYTKLPAKKKPEITIPKKEDVDRLVEVAQRPLKTAILLASQQGLRRSEISALTIDDYKDGKISISKAVVQSASGEWQTKQPKTYSGYRTLPVTPDVEAEIKSLELKPGDKIAPLKPGNISVYFDRLLKDHPEIPHFRFHDLRHYYASVLLSLNIPNKYAMQRMGHATDNMLKTVYQHTMTDKQKEIDDSIGAYFSQNTTQNTTHPEKE